MKRLSSDALCRGAVLPLPHGQAQLRGHPCPDGTLEITVTLPYRAAYGMGEKYDALNQKGHTVCNQVEEKFCFRGEKTYCPAPFFWTDSGFGPYADTREVTRFCFAEGQIHLSLPAGCSLVLFSGTPAQIIRDYLSLFGPVRLPPKWAFGLWVSANHWDSQQKILQVVQELETRTARQPSWWPKPGAMKPPFTSSAALALRPRPVAGRWSGQIFPTRPTVPGRTRRP